MRTLHHLPCDLPKPHQDGNVIVAEASGICDVDGVVVIVGIGTGRLSDLTVLVSTSSEGSSLVGIQVAPLSPMNATNNTDSGFITSPGVSVAKPHATMETSSTVGPSISDVLTGKARRAAEGGRMWMLLSVVMTWGCTSLRA